MSCAASLSRDDATRPSSAGSLRARSYRFGRNPTVRRRSRSRPSAAVNSRGAVGVGSLKSCKTMKEAYGKRQTTGMRKGMREPYVEDIASHGGPESCVGDPRGRSEALTGVHAGRLLSLETPLS